MLALVATIAQIGSAVAGAVQSRTAAVRNQRLANRQAEDVLEQSRFDIANYRTNLAQSIGSQRVATAAQDIAVGEGTAGILETQAQRIGERDIAQLEINAEREAWGIRTNARNQVRAATNRLVATGIGAAGAAAVMPFGDSGRTLLTRAGDAWTNFVGTRRFNALAGRSNAMINDSLRGL